MATKKTSTRRAASRGASTKAAKAARIEKLKQSVRGRATLRAEGAYRYSEAGRASVSRSAKKRWVQYRIDHGLPAKKHAAR